MLSSRLVCCVERRRLALPKAKQLHLSSSTIGNHLQHIAVSLNVRRFTHATSAPKRFAKISSSRCPSSHFSLTSSSRFFSSSSDSAWGKVNVLDVWRSVMEDHQHKSWVVLRNGTLLLDYQFAVPEEIPDAYNVENDMKEKAIAYLTTTARKDVALVSEPPSEPVPLEPHYFGLPSTVASSGWVVTYAPYLYVYVSPFDAPVRTPSSTFLRKISKAKLEQDIAKPEIAYVNVTQRHQALLDF